MKSFSLDKFTTKGLSLDENVWTNQVGETTTILHNGERNFLIKLPPLKVKYGCKDYKRNKKYAMTLTVDSETEKKLVKIEEKLSDLFKAPIKLVSNKELKLKMCQNKDDDIITDMYDKSLTELIPDSSLITKNSTIRVAINIRSVFKNAVKHYPQVYASQIMIMESEPQKSCVF